jgi:hypothetical protein
VQHHMGQNLSNNPQSMSLEEYHRPEPSRMDRSPEQRVQSHD